MTDHLTLDPYEAYATTSWMTQTQMGMHCRLMLTAGMRLDLGVPNSRTFMIAAMGDETRRLSHDLDMILSSNWTLGADGRHRNRLQVFGALMAARSRAGSISHGLSPSEWRERCFALSGRSIQSGFDCLEDLFECTMTS